MRYRLIAIEREYASGGREIGESLTGRWAFPATDATSPNARQRS